MIYILLSIFSGLMLTLSFPSPGWHFLAWFALIPLFFIASQQSSLIRLTFLGILSGLVHYFTLLYWIVQSLCHLVHLPFSYSLIIFCMLSLYLSLYPAFFLIACNRLCKNAINAIIVLPATWVVLEYCRTYFLSGFPWGLIGYTQYQKPLIIQLANITGVYGISYLIVMGNVSIFFLLMAISRKPWKRKRISWKTASGGVMVFIFLWGLSLWYGHYSIDSLDKHIQTYPMATFAIIQGNIDQSIKWDPQYTRASEKKYLNLSISQQKNQPDLIIWPETALTFYFQKKGRDTNKIKQFIQISQTDYMIGSPAYIKDEQGRYTFYNRAYLIGKDGTVKDQYDKYHLVPFGEYIPFQNSLPFLKKFVEGENNFSSGKNLQPIQWKNYQLAVQICYEIIFPNLCRSIVQKDAHIIINMTNDAWFGRTSAPYQHFAMAVFRAVENRRALVRSANTGISGLIDPVGRVVTSTPIFKDVAMTFKAPLMNHQSLYTRYGDFFAGFCVLIVFLKITECIIFRIS
ncbi:MAG: apolipoprotein N-acyltransferase [Candidatus Magnetomorum sp.]|nr:apolipoprotein N-acyltransferase [Candidatus Magnetomorum sp.]